MPARLLKLASLTSLALLACSPAAHADLIWSEVVNGDLSGDRFAPTPLILAPGTNDLFGILAGHSHDTTDLDYYSFTIPVGYVLSEITLGFYESVDTTAFMAIQPGPVFPNDPATVQAEDLMGWAHFGAADVFSNLLPLMGANGQTFTPPLQAGTYTIWAQQTDDYTEYYLQFVVETPAPAGLSVLAAAGMLMAQRRRR